LEGERREKLHQLQAKFEKLSNSKRSLDTSMVEFMSAKKESNAYRMLEHE
jgi:chaperonin cofactor prefoldin